MTVLARIAPHRVSQRLSFLVVDPFAVEGLAMVRALRERDVVAEVSTSVSHGITLAHRSEHSIVVIKHADSFSAAEVALFARLASTRMCFVLTDRESAIAMAVRKGELEAKIVPPNVDIADLLGAVRWALQTARPSSRAKAGPVSVTAANGPVAGEFRMDPTPVRQTRSDQPLRVTLCVMRPVQRKTLRFIPAVSYKHRSA